MLVVIEFEVLVSIVDGVWVGFVVELLVVDGCIVGFICLLELWIGVYGELEFVVFMLGL